MQTSTFRTFFYKIKSKEDRSIFRKEFLSRSGLSYPSFDNYKKLPDKKIMFVFAQIIKDIAAEQQPTLVHLLDEPNTVKRDTKISCAEE